MFERIFELNKEKNQSVQDLADFLGVGNKTLYDWKEGRTNPSVRILVKLAEHFDVSTDYLLGLSDYKNPSRSLKNCFGSLDITPENIDEVQRVLKILKIYDSTKDIPIDKIELSFSKI